MALLPSEITDRIIALSVTEKSIVEIWTHFPGIKYFISETKIDWKSMSYSQILSENFIRSFSDRVNWEWVSVYQTLSENFIREFSDRVHWYWIPRRQNLSNNFISEFKHLFVYLEDSEESEYSSSDEESEYSSSDEESEYSSSDEESTERRFVNYGRVDPWYLEELLESLL
jgi:hypothetical protein